MGLAAAVELAVSLLPVDEPEPPPLELPALDVLELPPHPASRSTKASAASTAIRGVVMKRNGSDSGPERLAAQKHSTLRNPRGVDKVTMRWPISRLRSGFP